MNKPDSKPGDLEFEELLDRLFFGDENGEEVNEEVVQKIESVLLNNPDRKQRFLDFAEFAFSLKQGAKLTQLQAKVMETVSATRSSSSGRPIEQPKWRGWFIGGISLAILIGFAIGMVVTGGNSETASESSSIAWLVNAQACHWDRDHHPHGNMQPNDRLSLQSGVAMIRFECGADVILEGPADLELLSATSINLLKGKASVKVPEGMKGFEVFSPQGRVLDLGTEFGVTVSGTGSTDVVVFDGEVETFVGRDRSTSLRLRENESATISQDKMMITKVAQSFLRTMEDVAARSNPIPRTSVFEYGAALSGGIRDQNGMPIGFDTRLPGTGGELLESDENLVINTDEKLLQMTTTRSDINRQVNLANGEYIGIKLSQFGFSGDEDFSVTVELPDIPNLEDFGQFGLFAGTRSDQVIRGGLIKWGGDQSKPNTLFMVNNHGGTDSDSNKVGLLNKGIDVKLTLARRAGKYTLTAENLSDGGEASLSIRHPEFLDDQNEMIVGIFGANPFSDVRKTVSISNFSVTVWEKPDRF